MSRISNPRHVQGLNEANDHFIITDPGSVMLSNHDVMNWVQEQKVWARQVDEQEEAEGLTGVVSGRPANWLHALDKVPALYQQLIVEQVEEYMNRDFHPWHNNPKYTGRKDRNKMYRDLMVALDDADLDLVKTELLQLFNTRPLTLPVLGTIVEEMDSRFDEEEQLQILEIVKNILGGGEEDDDMDAAADGEDTDAVVDGEGAGPVAHVEGAGPVAHVEGAGPVAHVEGAGPVAEEETTHEA
ncbi:hypothetical protein LTR66_001739 [Elasticomyces elasticus]|nr:hypothetical protein LTR66_001739 [Elasticomyces elasticus]